MIPIIFGKKVYYKDLGEIVLPCPHCMSTSTFKAQLWTRRHHVYYAPLSKIDEGYIFTCGNCKKQIGIFDPIQVKRYSEQLTATGGIVSTPDATMMAKVIPAMRRTVSGDIKQMSDTFKRMPTLGKLFMVAITVLVVCCFPATFIFSIFTFRPNPRPTPTQSFPAGILFQDNFSNPKSGWTPRDDAKVVKAYVDGEFSMRTKAANFSTLSLILEAGLFQKAIHLDVTARDVSKYLLAEPVFGLACFVDEKQNLYVGSISANGYYIIIQTINGNTNVLTDGRSKDITKNSASYRIGLDCDGKEVALYVDGKLIAKATGESIAEGVVGVSVFTFQQGDTEVRFDDFVVTPKIVLPLTP